jgi:phosphate-selective porin OprO and OprP
MALLACIVALLLAASPALADTLTLNTGEQLFGKVISDSGSTVVFESQGLGKITVARELVKSIERPVPAKEESPAPAAAPVAVAAPAAAGPAPVVPDRTASELPEDKPTAPSVPPKSQREDLLRMWVDQGLRYQIVQPVEIPRPFEESVMREEVRVTGRFGLRMSVDAAGFDTSKGLAPIDPAIEMRTLRLYTGGNWSPTTTFWVAFESVSGTFNLQSAWMRWREVPYFENVTFGYMTVPQLLDNVVPFGALTFMEVGLPVGAFAPGNRMGFQADRSLWNHRGSLAYGIFSVGADPGLSFGSATQSLLLPVVRLTGLPVFDENRQGGRQLLHLGLSLSATLASNSGVQYRARPESFIAPYLLDTGAIDSKGSTMSGLEALWMRGPFSLQGEIIYSNVQNSQGDGLYGLWGSYALASWMLTGEEAGYNQSVGIPERVIPNRDYSSKAGTWGAWQVAGRLSYVDLNDGLVAGGRSTEAMLGLNWWWNRYFRWQLNYGYAIIEGGPTPGHLQLLQLRAQLMY